MCMGIPMQVIEVRDGVAVCEGMGERRVIDTLMVGRPPVGAWLMTFLGSAREILTEEDAHRITDAVSAVQRVMQGDFDVDHLFADLIDREPPRPPGAPAPDDPDS